MLRRILIFFILIIILAFLFWSSLSLQNIFYETAFSIKAYAVENQLFVITVFVALAALSATLSPFSSIPFVPVMIMVWGNVLTAIFLLIGWLIGEILAYFIGYYAGYPVVRQLSSFEKIKYYKEKLSKKTEFFLVLLFRFAMPAEIPGYALGILRYNFNKYLLATFIAELPFAFIVSYASDALISNRPAIFMIFVILSFLFFGITFYLFNKKLR